MPEIQRVLHIVHGFPPESSGGTETYVSSLLAEQPSLGIEPFLLHGSFEPRPEPELVERTDLAVPAWCLHRSDAYSDFWDKSHYPPAVPLFEEVLETCRPDLVHVHQWIRLTDDLGRQCTARGVPYVVSLHDVYSSCPACFRLRPDDSHCERSVGFENCRDCVPVRGTESETEIDLAIRVYRDNFRAELIGARAVLAATSVTAALVTDGLGLPRDLVEILPLGYADRFAGIELPQWSPPEAGRPLRLAYWGVVTRRKGVQVFLTALKQLAQTRELAGAIEFHVFGRVDTEALETELQALASGLPVTFHGRYDYEQLATLAPHVAVFPSTCFETYGFVLDEAFELGVPALVTDIGAFGERCGDRGILVPPGDIDAIAATVAKWLDDPSELVTAQQRVARVSPTSSEHAERLLGLYRSTAKTPQAAFIDVDPDDRDELEYLRSQHDRDSRPTQRGIR